MSSIAITGGATGTGVFSLLAPSTSTNQTLTLPDQTGTLITTSDLPTTYLVHTLFTGTSFTPKTGCKGMYVAVVGATGGKAAAGYGGVGGPGFSEKYYSSVSGSYTFALGAGGSTTGTAGGTTTFGVISVTGGAGVTGTAGGGGGVGSGGDFNATGGTGGLGSVDYYGSGGGAGTRAGNGGNAANILSGGSGGTGGNSSSSGVAGAAATVKAAGALDLQTLLGVQHETFAAGSSWGAGLGLGASSRIRTDLTYVLFDVLDTTAGGSKSSRAGSSGQIIIVEIL